MARTNVRVTAFITRGKKILIIHRFKEGKYYWVLPGGAMEEGETVEEALIREVKEETGFDVAHSALLDHSDPKWAFYFVKTSEGEPALGGPESEANSPENQFVLEWMDREQFRDLKNVYPHQSPSFVDRIAYED